MRKHGIIPCVTVQKVFRTSVLGRDASLLLQESEPVSLVPEKPLAKRLMSRYASLLDSSFFKVLNLKIVKQVIFFFFQAAVLTITAGLLAFGIYGSVNIVQRFEDKVIAD